MPPKRNRGPRPSVAAPSLDPSAPGITYVCSVPGTPQTFVDPASGGGSLAADSPGPSSLVTDVNSSGRPGARRSASSNNECSEILPASPQSFSSNIVDGNGSFIPKQRASGRKQPQKAKELPSLPTPHKKPRFATPQDENIHTESSQQQIPMGYGQQQGQMPQLLGQQQPQQRLISQPVPPMQQSPVHPQLHQLRNNNMRSHGVQVPTSMRPPLNARACMERLKQFCYYLRRRPADNSLLYWRKFVAEYYAPQAKERWCFSSYDDVSGCEASKAAWGCGLCGAKSGKGYEATFEILPRLSQIKFDHGLIDQLFFFDMPRERRLSSGLMVLEFAKAVQESGYVQQRVYHEGHLRIIFTPDLKILCWEFCVRRHEEFFRRSSLVPQVNLLIAVAHKYQTAVAESGSAGISPQELQKFCDMFKTASDLIARSLQPGSFTGLGLSKGFACSLQMSETAASMKDLIDFSEEHNIGPIESLQKYAKQPAASVHCSAILNPTQLRPGPCQQPPLGINLAQQNDSMGYYNMSQPLKSDIARCVPAMMVNSANEAPRQSLNDPSASATVEGETALKSSFNCLSGPSQHPPLGVNLVQQNDSMGYSNVCQPLKSDVARHAPENMVNSMKDASRQSFSKPSASATMEVEADSGCSGGNAGQLPASSSVSIKNGSGSGDTSERIPNDAAHTIPSGNSDFKPSSSDSTVASESIPQDLQPHEMDPFWQELIENGFFGSEL